MLRRIITITTTAFIAVSGLVMTAEAAPFSVADGATSKDGAGLVQIRGGRGGGFGGYRGGGRSFGATGTKFGGGFRTPIHKPGHHGHHGHHHWRKGHVVIGGGYDAGSDCRYYWNRWQATGSYHWKSKYYACIGD